MPRILDAAVKRVRAKGHSLSSSYAIATHTLQKAGEAQGGQQQAYEAWGEARRNDARRAA